MWLELYQLIVITSYSIHYTKLYEFKVDALLQNKDDLRLIKKQNRKIAKEFSLENNFKKFEKCLSKLDS